MTHEEIAEAIEELDALDGDQESAHGKADDILLNLVPSEVAEAWCRARDRVGGFWYA